VDARAINIKRASSQDFKNGRVTVDGGIMAKGYWIVFYRNVSNPVAVAQYAKPAEAAILAAGGRFLARGTASKQG
jgi:hypothetical protein